MNGQLKDKNIVITGASRGIGFATAKLLLEEGARVFCYSRTMGKLQELSSHGGMVFYPCDFSSLESIEKILPTLPSNLDGLVINAAYFERKLVQELSLSLWQSHLQVNLNHAFIFVQAAWQALAQARGSIVLVSSLAGMSFVEKFAGASAYTASKMALTGLGEVIAAEGRDLGIRCNILCPGAVDTEMLRRVYPDFKPNFRAQDIARHILFWLSPLSAPATGNTIPIMA